VIRISRLILFRMRLNAGRDYEQPADPDAYWRRRFFILGGGLAVLALLAWFFTGHEGPAAGASAAARASMAALQARSGLPSAAYGSAWPGLPATPSAAATPQPSAAKPRTPAATAAASGGPRCAPADIVLSLFTSQPSYRRGERPRFDVFAVSTAAGECRLAYGAGSVRVIVTSHGQVVWDSAACKPAAAAPVRFELGVPQMVTISWNPAAAKPSGCAGSLPRDASGTFQAVAMTAGQSSPVRTFTLLR